MDKELIQKYFQNKCTPAEAKKVLQWFETKEGGEYFEKLITEKAEYFEESPMLFDVHQDQKRRVLNKIKKAIDKSDVRSIEKRPIWKKNIVKVAASFVFIALAVGGYFLTDKQSKFSHQTAYGEKTHVILPDGSEVFLNGNSSISLKEEFEKQRQREVWLEGEAFFHVVHTEADTEFIVHNIDGTSVEVLGTEFNVDTRSNRTKVVLSNGKVKFSLNNKNKKEILMEPNDLIQFNSENQELTKKIVDADVYSSWRGEKLLFDQTSFAEIKENLENTYGFKISVKDSTLLKEKVSGSIPSADVNVILEGLARLLNFQHEKEKNEIVIHKKTNNQPK